VTSVSHRPRAAAAGRIGVVVHIVWLDEWQWACCGEPFSVGTPVRWNLETVSPDHRVRAKLTSLLSAEVADRVTHEEDHHGMHPQGAETSGVVRRITAVHGRSASNDSGIIGWLVELEV
jgi:hypothetical protein